MKVTKPIPRLFHLAAAALLLAGGAYAADPDPLALPLSPGSVALLIERSSEPAVQERWRQALKSPDADVRAATLRVILVTQPAAMSPDLRAALAAERDVELAGMTAETLAALDPASDEVLVNTIRAAGGQMRDRLLTGFARGAAGRAGALFATWIDLGLSRAEWHSLFRALGQRDPREFGRMASRALGVKNDDPWLGLLAAEASNAISSPPLLAAAGMQHAATQSPSITKRAATVFYVAHVGRRHPLAISLDGAPPATDPVERFARELLRRSSQQDRADIADVLAALRGRAPDLLRMVDSHEIVSLATLLTRDEQSALAAVLAVDAVALQKAAATRAESMAKGPPASDPRPSLPARTVGPFPDRFVADVLALTGCKVDDGIALAQARYEGPGRVAALEYQSRGLGSQCEQAARVLLKADLPRGFEPAAIVVLPARREFLSCLSDARIAMPIAPTNDDNVSFSLDGPRVGRQIQEPRIKRRVQPVYPDAARVARIQGVVILEATVSTTGCISSLEIVRGIDASINTAAFLAVSQWSYTPTLLDGVPVPVTMTVTVNFKLN